MVDDEVLGPFDVDPDVLSVAGAAVTGERFRFEAVDTTGGNTGFVAIEIYTE